MKRPFIEIGAENFYMPGFDPKKLEGCELPKKFPFCCPKHTAYFDNCLSWFINFPNCCKNHREMKSKVWFKKENYASIPKKAVTLIYYTEYFILNKHKKDDWFKDICDYIEYCVHSFGHPNTGMFLYYTYLINRLVDGEDLLPNSKRLKLIEYLKMQYENGVETPMPSLNVLFDTYRKWLDTFPFDIAFFKELKAHFETTLPFLETNPVYNRYTGISKAKIVTQSQLIQSLIKMTFELLGRVDIKKITDNELVGNSEEYSFELIKESHRIKQNKLLNNYSIDEIPYVDVLNEWLNNEICFFKEMRGFIDSPVAGSSAYKAEIPLIEERISLSAYALFHVYLRKVGGQGVTQQNKKSLAEKYGFTSGDKLRNEFLIYQNDDKRLDLHLTNKKSANAHLERYKSIFNLLQKASEQAYQEANKDFQLLDKEYRKHY